MTEHKFTDEEIIKALEVCVNNSSCKECPINPNYGNYGYCTNLALSHALNLINRQKVEIEVLKAERDNYKTWYFQTVTELEEAKAEAVKAFAERLKKYYARLNGKTAAGCVEYHIDQIAKEMLEGGAINSKDNH